ncbi:MAG: Xaa-Pro peptidase family protein [Bacteroidia bacterium]|nr:Xaa-Pro peptidase family protein [Bacteroidia bacterium]
MNNRRDFLKTAAVSAFGIAAGVSVSAENKHIETTGPINQDDLTKNLPDITRDDYLARQEKAKEWLIKSGIDALFVEGGNNLSYFTNTAWWSSERVFGFLLSPHADIVWICPAFEKQRAEEVIEYGNDIRVWQEHESPYSLFPDYLKKISKASGKIGIDPNARSFVNEGLRRAGGVQVVDGSVITENTRAVKSEKEIILMDMANRITKLAFKQGFSRLKEGMTTGDLSQIIQKAHTELGASGGGFALFGTNAAFPHGTRNIRNLQHGDVVVVDGGCSVKGYKSDVTRTAVLGKPSDELKKVFVTVWNAQQAAFKAITNGAICGDVDKAARKEMAKGGYGADYEYFTHRLGHGIGIEGHEFPYLVKNNPLKMTTGMTFTNEPGLYLYGKLGVRIEDSLVVTDNGCKILGGMPCLSIDDILSDTL